jgi:hypothetical protein
MAGWSVMPLCADGWAGGRYAATGAPVAVHRILGCQSADVGSLSFPVNVRFFFFFFFFFFFGFFFFFFFGFVVFCFCP